jgi:hypothetical protein
VTEDDGGNVRGSGEAVFETALRESVISAQQQLERAHLEAQPSQVHRHAARLLDLLDRARVNDIDTTGWVPPAVMAVVIASAADTG